VQLPPRVGAGDLAQEAQELLVVVPIEAGVHPPGGDLQRREQGGVPCRT
jgi:hypothetical protein